MRAAARRQFNRSPKLPRPRKNAQVQRHSEFELFDGNDLSSVEEMTSPKLRQRPEVGSTPSLYTIFQNILEVHVHLIICSLWTCVQILGEGTRNCFSATLNLNFNEGNCSCCSIFFSFSLQKLTTKLHPETVLHIVNLLNTLIHSCYVLDWADSKEQALQDILNLFNK